MFHRVELSTGSRFDGLESTYGFADRYVKLRLGRKLVEVSSLEKKSILPSTLL